MLQGYSEPRLKSPTGKFHSHYNYLICDYKLSLPQMLNDLLHALSITVVSILALTTGNPVYQILTKGAWRKLPVSRLFSSMAPDPTFAFVGGPCCPTLDFVFGIFFGIRIMFNIFNSDIRYIDV
jgi:hypothetical protein